MVYIHKRVHYLENRRNYGTYVCGINFSVAEHIRMAGACYITFLFV